MGRSDGGGWAEGKESEQDQDVLLMVQTRRAGVRKEMLILFAADTKLGGLAEAKFKII